MKEVVAVQKGRFREIVTDVKLLFDEGAAAWRLSQRVMGVILLLPIIVAAAGVFSALFGKETYKWFTGEDGFAETLQVILYFLALVMALFLVSRHYRAGDRLLALLYLGLSLGFLFMVGEEISWGQRLFGWVTPAAMVEINKQQETSLHNIYGVEYAFKWLQMLVGAYGAILPLVVLFWPPRVKWEKLINAVVPHYTLVLYFLPMFIWRLFRNTSEVPPSYRFVVAEFNEVVELILTIGFALFMAFQWRQRKERKNVKINLALQ